MGFLAKSQTMYVAICKPNILGRGPINGFSVNPPLGTNIHSRTKHGQYPHTKVVKRIELFYVALFKLFAR